MGSCASTPVASTDPRREFLHQLPLFQNLPPEAVNVFVVIMEPYMVSRGSSLVKEGEKGQHIYLISEGEAEVTKLDEATKKNVRISQLTRGDFVGLGSLLEQTTHSSTVTALTDPQVKTFRVSHDAFNKLMKEHPTIGVSMCKYLNKELREFRTKVTTAATPTTVAVAAAPAAAVAPAPAAPADGSTIMVLYDHKSYERKFFDDAIAKTNAENPAATIVCRYVDSKLNMASAELAKGAKIACIFVNDDASPEVLRRLHSVGVRMIALRCAGFNNCALETCQSLGINVVRVPAYSPYAVAEHCVALLLALNRKTHIAYNRVKTGNFSLNNLVGFDIHGKTVGVIGTGKIGYCFIQIMLGFGCTVLGFDKYRNSELENSTPGFRYTDTVEELLRESRIVSIHCPLLADNKHMINKDSIALMPKGVIIINTSRGALIKSTDLIEALKDGHVGGAGLDVYEDEQSYFFEDKSGEVIVDDTLARLLSFQNVMVTSHQAFLTEEALQAIASVTLANVKEFVVDGKEGKALTNVVTS